MSFGFIFNWEKFLHIKFLTFQRTGSTTHSWFYCWHNSVCLLRSLKFVVLTCQCPSSSLSRLYFCLGKMFLYWSVDLYNNKQKCWHVVHCSGKKGKGWECSIKGNITKVQIKSQKLNMEYWQMLDTGVTWQKNFENQPWLAGRGAILLVLSLASDFHQENCQNRYLFRNSAHIFN